MKKISLLMSAVVLLICYGCPSKNERAADSLVLCTSLTYPPYESVDAQGKPVGFDIEIAEAIAKNLNKTLSIKDMAFDSLILSLEQNKCDFILAGMSITPSRQKEITMLPYQGEATKSYALLFWEKSPVSLEQLKGQTIAVMAGSWMEVFLRSQPDVTSKALESNTELVMELQFRKSAAALVEVHIAKDLREKLPKLTSIELPLPEAEWNMGNGLGIKKSNTQLAGQIQAALEQIKKSGLSTELAKKWLPKS